MLKLRYQFLVLLPFFVSALVPWLSPDASPRVALLTVVWAGLLNIFAAGFCAGDAAQHLAGKPRLRLQIIAAVALVILTIVALVTHFLISPVASIAILALGMFCNTKLLRMTHYGSSISELDFKFFIKTIWVAIGCLLMLAFSYYRYVSTLT